MAGIFSKGMQTRNYVTRIGQFHLRYAAQRGYCESKDDETPPPPKEPQSQERKDVAKQRLSDLLSSLATSDTIPVEKLPEVQLSRPKPRRKKVEEVDIPPEDMDREVADAAKDVAESLGGNTAQIESELLSALKSHAESSSSSTTEEEKETASISDLFVGMKVERSRKSAAPESRPRRVYKRGLDVQESQAMGDTQKDGLPRAATPFRRKEYKRVNLFGAEPLKIFSNEKEYTGKASILSTWKATRDRELQLMVSHPPANGFEEMILWTKHGKMWHFPVDNEYGLEDNVGFYDHVFLERHLEDWCPKRGPIRHFMELVCTGLSKNPYLTVERKKNHIMWYRDYFENKGAILEEIGAM